MLYILFTLAVIQQKMSRRTSTQLHKYLESLAEEGDAPLSDVEHGSPDSTGPLLNDTTNGHVDKKSAVRRGKGSGTLDSNGYASSYYPSKDSLPSNISEMPSFGTLESRLSSKENPLEQKLISIPSPNRNGTSDKGSPNTKESSSKNENSSDVQPNVPSEITLPEQDGKKSTQSLKASEIKSERNISDPSSEGKVPLKKDLPEMSSEGTLPRILRERRKISDSSSEKKSPLSRVNINSEVKQSPYREALNDIVSGSERDSECESKPAKVRPFSKWRQVTENTKYSVLPEAYNVSKQYFDLLFSNL